MDKRARCFLFLGLVVLSLVVLTTCKPITYYLAQVYKAYGTVTDDEGNPLESVEVSIKGYQYSELTNGLGDYELELAAGTWTLEFAKEGYATAESEPFPVGPDPLDQRKRVDAVLTAEGIVGKWDWFGARHKYSPLLQLFSDHTWISWEDYACTIEGDGGTWSQSEDTLTLVVDGGALEVTLDWQNPSCVQFSVPWLSTPISWYRKGSEPDGYLFGNALYPPLALSREMAVGGNLAPDGLIVYEYQAGPNASNTIISWQDGTNTAGYTSDLQVWIYIDEDTVVPAPGTEDEPRHTESPAEVSLAAGQTYYLVVGNQPLSGGDFSLLVHEGGTSLLTVTGTITIDGLVSDPAFSDELIYVAIDTSLTDLGNLANLDYYVTSWVAHGTPSYEYSIPGVQAGTYYLGAAIDIDGNGGVNLGDYAFIYGGLNPMSPDPPNVVVDAAHTVYDFEIDKLEP